MIVSVLIRMTEVKNSKVGNKNSQKIKRYQPIEPVSNNFYIAVLVQTFWEENCALNIVL